jgi:hypothetical protein
MAAVKLNIVNMIDAKAPLCSNYAGLRIPIFVIFCPLALYAPGSTLSI